MRRLRPTCKKSLLRKERVVKKGLVLIQSWDKAKVPKAVARVLTKAKVKALSRPGARLLDQEPKEVVQAHSQSTRREALVYPGFELRRGQFCFTLQKALRLMI